ncbi:MAG: Mu-like prophage major head subunit gpT family protein [Phycisphaeraceae bacterium]
MPRKATKKIDVEVPPEPQPLEMRGTAQIEAAQDEEGGSSNSLPRFSMVAYTGDAMRLRGWRHPVVVDLASLDVSAQSRPIRLGHSARDGVGHTERIAIEDGKLIAEGTISRDTPAAKEVVASSRNGFPWQASIGAGAQRVELVRPGRRVEVNGRSFEGPIYVAYEAALGEISFVDLGADTATSARIAAENKETDEMDFNEWLEAKEFDSEQLSEAQTESLKAAFEAEQTKGAGDGTEPDKGTDATPASRSDTTEPANVAEQMRAEAAAESKRIAGIRDVCAGKHNDIEAKAIEEGWDTTRTELEVLRASRPQAPMAGIGHDRQPDRNALVATACMAGGMGEERLLAGFGEQTLDKVDRLAGLGFQEFCELAAGQRLPRYHGDASGWLQAAFSTMTLPGILSNVANKMLLDGFNYVEDAWRRICKIGSVRDFKQHTRYRLTGDMKYQKVGPDGELKHGELGEESFTQQAETHGLMFSLTRTDIINDDLGAFAAVPQMLGMGAAEAIAEAVFSLLLSNPGSFFSANNNNLKIGADTALSIDSLTAAEQMFLEQTKPNGRPLAVSPSVLLVPPALNVLAHQLMNATQVNETTTTNKAKPANNPHAGKYGVVNSAYLSNATFTGNSNKAWYLLADPNRLPALEVAFLNGRQRPTVERADADFNTLGVQFRGYIDFGVKEQDHRGAVKMKGEA